MTQEEFFRKVSHDGLTERLDFLYPAERYPRMARNMPRSTRVIASASTLSSTSSCRWAFPATS